MSIVSCLHEFPAMNRAALISSQGNTFQLRAASLFHSSPMLERRRRTHWDSVSVSFYYIYIISFIYLVYLEFSVCRTHWFCDVWNFYVQQVWFWKWKFMLVVCINIIYCIYYREESKRCTASPWIGDFWIFICGNRKNYCKVWWSLLFFLVVQGSGAYKGSSRVSHWRYVASINLVQGIFLIDMFDLLFNAAK